MGYWPNKMKRRRHNWVTELGRKLVLLGCTGHHETLALYTRKFPNTTHRKMYVLNRPGYEGETAWADGVPHLGTTQVKAWTEDSATVKGARMMEII